MSVTSVVNGNKINIKVSGRFDFSCHRDFRQIYLNLPENEHTQFELDMSETDYLDSSALGMLLLLREHVGNDENNISISHCNSEVKEVLLVSNFDKLFNIS